MLAAAASKPSLPLEPPAFLWRPQSAALPNRAAVLRHPRLTDSGLGCPDWPRCFGSWIPPASAAQLPTGFDASQFNETLMWTEYLNRLLGVIVGLLIFATLISAWRHHRRTPRIYWPTLAAFLLVGFQGWLGGVVVEQELAPWIVTVHLIVALLIVSLLLYSTVYAFFADKPLDARNVRGPLAWSTLLLIALTLGQVTLGAQVRENTGEQGCRAVVEHQAVFRLVQCRKLRP